MSARNRASSSSEKSAVESRFMSALRETESKDELKQQLSEFLGASGFGFDERHPVAKAYRDKINPERKRDSKGRFSK